jgi:tRNA(Arg) A34 adenosine deaminase TadA
MKNKKQILSFPIKGTEKIYNLPTKKINGKHVWNGYIPKCKLHNQADCEKFVIQKSNIKKDNIYKEIEIEGDEWMERTCELAKVSVENKGGPFGAIILQIDDETNEILRFWESNNQVTTLNDPSAHAEMMAIRSACHSLGVFNLGEIKKEDSLLPQKGRTSSCVLYSSTEPCPMCYSALCWARIPTLLFATTRFDAAVEGVAFSDEEIYEELKKSYAKRKMKVSQCLVNNSLDAFNLWKRMEKKGY